MSQVLVRLSAGLVGAVLAVTTVHAQGKLEGALKVEQAVQANLLPFAPAYVTSKCLVPYPLCKFAYATVSLVASWEQLILGGDLKVAWPDGGHVMMTGPAVEVFEGRWPLGGS